MAGLFFDILCTVFKTPQITKGEPHEVPEKLKQISIATKLLIIIPSYIRARADDDPWYSKMDAVVTDFAFLKTILDASDVGETKVYGEVSPYVDSAIGAAWLVPAVGKVIENHKTRKTSFTTLTTDLAYDVAVMTALIIWSPSAPKQTKLRLLAGANVVIGICGVIKIATGGFLHHDH